MLEGGGTMKTCQNCGLGIEGSNDLVSCFKYKTQNNSQEEKTKCIYYIEIIVEDGEPLAPIQHLLLVEQDLGKRKMKISINDGLRM
jgi:hypothetical protein